MVDFLTFNKLITPYILIIVYYMGALFIPFLFFIYKRYFSKKIYSFLNIDKRWQIITLWVIYIMMILFMELGWRVFIEFFIAYFDMHDILYKIEQKI